MLCSSSLLRVYLTHDSVRMLRLLSQFVLDSSCEFCLGKTWAQTQLLQSILKIFLNVIIGLGLRRVKRDFFALAFGLSGLPRWPNG